MALAAAAFLSAVVYTLSRPATRARMGTWIIRIPAVGHQLHLYQLARLYRTTGMLLRGGIPAVAALEMSAGCSETIPARHSPPRRSRFAKDNHSPRQWNQTV